MGAPSIRYKSNPVQTVRQLEEARARFQSNDNIVLDWHHSWEDAEGNWLCALRDATRFCIAGAITSLTEGNEDALKYMLEAYRELMPTSRHLFKPHSIEEIHAILDRAIAKAIKAL